MHSNQTPYDVAAEIGPKAGGLVTGGWRRGQIFTGWWPLSTFPPGAAE